MLKSAAKVLSRSAFVVDSCVEVVSCTLSSKCLVGLAFMDDDVDFIEGLLLGNAVGFVVGYVDGRFVCVLVCDSVSISHSVVKPKYTSISSPNNRS